MIIAYLFSFTFLVAFLLTLLSATKYRAKARVYERLAKQTQARYEELQSPLKWEAWHQVRKYDEKRDRAELVLTNEQKLVIKPEYIILRKGGYTIGRIFRGQ